MSLLLKKNHVLLKLYIPPKNLLIVSRVISILLNALNKLWSSLVIFKFYVIVWFLSVKAYKALMLILLKKVYFIFYKLDRNCLTNNFFWSGGELRVIKSTFNSSLLLLLFSWFLLLLRTSCYLLKYYKL